VKSKNGRGILEKSSYWSMSKNVSLHSQAYIVIITREYFIKKYIIWKPVKSTQDWYRNISTGPCFLSSNKPILSRLKTYETPCSWRLKHNVLRECFRHSEFVELFPLIILVKKKFQIWSINSDAMVKILIIISALSATSAWNCQYFDHCIAIYWSNLEFFFTKMISGKSSTNSECRKHSLRTLCFSRQLSVVTVNYTSKIWNLP
jgi:hypothetical protein